MTGEKIIERLFGLQDKEYGSLQARTIPSVDKKRIIGVRTPALRSFAKELAGKAMWTLFCLRFPINILRRISFMLLWFRWRKILINVLCVSKNFFHL